MLDLLSIPSVENLTPPARVKQCIHAFVFVPLLSLNHIDCTTTIGAIMACFYCASLVMAFKIVPCFSRNGILSTRIGPRPCRLTPRVVLGTLKGVRRWTRDGAIVLTNNWVDKSSLLTIVLGIIRDGAFHAYREKLLPSLAVGGLLS